MSNTKSIKDKAKLKAKAKSKSTPKRKAVGRPKIAITDKILQKAETLASSGLTMAEIADVLGMGESTLYEKTKEFPEFSDAVKAGRAKGMAKVANVVFDKATGGDLTAAMFYLKTRGKGNWSERQEVDVSLNNQITEITQTIVYPEGYEPS